MRPTSQDIYALFLIGGSSNDPSTRQVDRAKAGPETPVPGPSPWWQRFIARHTPKIDAMGFDGIWLHNPFGCPPTGHNMEFDQYPRAKKEVSWLTDQFVESWMTYILRTHKKLILYLGTVLGNDGFGGFDNSQFSQRIKDSLYPVEELRKRLPTAKHDLIQVGLDMSVGYQPATQVGKYLIEYLRTRSIPYVREAWPQKDNPDSHTDRWSITDGYYQIVKHDKSQGRRLDTADDWEMSGNCTRILMDNPPYFGSPNTYKEVAQQALRDGHGIAVAYEPLVAQGVTSVQELR